MRWFARRDLRSEHGILLFYSRTYRRRMPACILTEEDYNTQSVKDKYVELTPDIIQERGWGQWLKEIEHTKGITK
jgi:hypothetical protein